MRKITKTRKTTRNREIYIPDLESKIVYRKINSELRNKYNIKLQDRDSIIKSIINILTQGDYNRKKIPNIDLTIVRSDIKDFFPSIDKHKLYQKISRSNILKKETLSILKPMFFNKNMKGVPLGFPFSSSLAEIYLEDFDEDLTTEFDPLFYFRYVDDILLILYHSGNSLNYKSKIKEIAKKYKLKINEKKEKTVHWLQNGKNASFNYLGYSFKKENQELIVDISDEKLSKFKKRIRGYFYDYSYSNQNDKQFWILYFRLKNEICAITSDYNENMKYGLGFSYKFINSEKQLTKLDDLIRYLIRRLKLNSFKRNTLFSLIHYEINKKEFIKRQYNYNKLTNNQLNKICDKLNISHTSYSSKKYKLKNIFHTIESGNS